MTTGYTPVIDRRQSIVRLAVLSIIAFVVAGAAVHADWSTMNISPKGLRTISFTTAERGYTAGKSGLYRTTNAGETWNLLSTPLDSLDGARAWPGTNGDIIYALSRGGKQVARSTDGGAQWNTRETGLAGGFVLGFYSFDEQTCFISGSEHISDTKTGFVIRTHNGGGTWEKVTFPGTYLISKVYFISRDEGYAVGTSTEAISDGLIYKTTDGGRTWTKKFTENIKQLNAVYAIDENTVIAAGFNGLIYRSEDAGETWEQVNPGAGIGAVLEGITFLNERDGYICGFGKIIYTRDGGHTWRLSASASMFTLLEDVVTVGETAYVAGSDLEAADMQGLVMKADPMPKPAMYLTAEEVALGEISEGATTSVEFDIMADTDAPLVVSSVSLRTADGKPTPSELGLSLSFSEEFPATVENGGFITVTVALQGVAAGPIEAELVIESNDPHKPAVTLPVTAVVTAQAKPSLTISAAAIDFGSMQREETKTIDISIRPGNTAALTLSAINLRTAHGATPAELGLSLTTSRTLPATLTGNEAITATISLTTKKSGMLEAELVITSNDETRPTTIIPITAVVGTTDVHEDGATALALRTYPNPAQHTTLVEFDIQKSGYAEIALFTMLGEKIAVPFTGNLPAGVHNIAVDLGALPTGAYICRLTAQGYSASRTISIAR